MPHKELKGSLNELKSELKQIPKETTQLEELLAHAQEGIERYTPEAVQDLIHALQQEAEEFEREHPRITALVNQIMTALSNLGI